MQDTTQVIRFIQFTWYY